MYFVFSKILLILLFPLSWIIVFIIIALFSKRARLKRRSLLIAMVLLLTFSNQFLLYEFAKCWDIDSAPLKKGTVYSTAIILGGFSGEDKNGNGYFNTSADRFLQGLKLKTNGQVSHIMVTSGNASLKPDGFSEGTWAKGQLKLFHIPDSAVLIEHSSRNTIENAAFSKVILKKSRLQPPFLLITSAFHMRRSLFIFKQEGMDVIPYSCNYINGNGKLGFDSYFLPDANTLAMWQIYLKELVGLGFTWLKYKL